MRVIWKKKLQSVVNIVKVPKGAMFLTAQIQPNAGGLVCWYMCDPDQPEEERTIWVIGTGNEINSDKIALAQYLGTVQADHNMIWHVFVR